MPPWKFDVNMIEKVTKKQVDASLREIINKNRMIISVVGNVK